VAPEVLEGLELRGLVVTWDALLAQRGLCRDIAEAGGEYLFTVKAKRPTLMEDIATLFADPPTKLAEVVQRNRHGDRQEGRRLQASSALSDYSDWPHLAQVCRIERTVTRKGGDEGGGGLRCDQSVASRGRAEAALGAEPRPLGDREPAALCAERDLGRVEARCERGQHLR